MGWATKYTLFLFKVTCFSDHDLCWHRGLKLRKHLRGAWWPGNFFWTNTQLRLPKIGIKNGYGSIPINTIFSGMNIHLPAILMFTRGTRFWDTAKCPKYVAWNIYMGLYDVAPMLMLLICRSLSVSPLLLELRTIVRHMTYVTYDWLEQF